MIAVDDTSCSVCRKRLTVASSNERLCPSLSPPQRTTIFPFSVDLSRFTEQRIEDGAVDDRDSHNGGIEAQRV